MRPYWVPRYRDEALDWIAKRHPQDRAKLARYQKRQLIAIYLSMRERIERGISA